ncbi:hypothetical protein SEA_ERDMANN_264 [Mycobacterium phage Erdmann]|uniref:Uncharacterized protein n=1 Tax=Mycobacterium phage Gizmo TaxID=1327936 RepID=R4TBD5_9CAUD|nr:hypothetical protein M181_gp094 [Mycobacterium phage Gizmo]AGM13529.1 hypothetical protein PBI_GIZMO_268 [Mycobacterium phage Gizmo]AOZ63355.1 hypothetical protein SEA_ERDMANN_264 [Mycobacterium phage Erdmann]
MPNSKHTAKENVMGSGAWDSYTYTSHLTAKAAAGKSTFDYTDQIRSGQTSAKANSLLDPKVKAGDASPFAGKVMREVVISDEHPNPTPIAIVLDVTGSNYTAAVAVHAKLPQLFGLLQRKGLIEDPQILIAATGDANSDRVPLQVGQFESDNRIDAMIEAMYLEGFGGGQAHETYELAAYFLARHTYLEPWHKQGRKGYAIFIGDEKPYDRVKASQVRAHIGVDIEADVPTTQVFEELKEQYEPFFLFQKQGSYSEGQVLPSWRKLLNEQAVTLEDPNNVCEFIAGLLLLREGGLDLDEVEDELHDAGFDATAIRSASKTLALVGPGGSGGAVAKTDGSLGLDDSTGTDRL